MTFLAFFFQPHSRPKIWVSNFTFSFVLLTFGLHNYRLPQTHCQNHHEYVFLPFEHMSCFFQDLHPIFYPQRVWFRLHERTYMIVNFLFTLPNCIYCWWQILQLNPLRLTKGSQRWTDGETQQVDGRNSRLSSKSWIRHTKDRVILGVELVLLFFRKIKKNDLIKNVTLTGSCFSLFISNQRGSII